MAKKTNLLSEQVAYNGEIFTKDRKAGYYLSARPIANGRRIRLHRYVWLLEHGEIPEGFHVHHKDDDKNNNAIENLILVPGGEHAKYHVNKDMLEHYDERVARLKKYACPAAAEWHGSKEGREWHREHWQRHLKKRMETKATKNCFVCGKEYEVPSTMRDISLFCSKKCKAKHRRDSGVDNEERTCIICGALFAINKYKKNETCSHKCGGALRGKRRGHGKSSGD